MMYDGATMTIGLGFLLTCAVVIVVVCAILIQRSAAETARETRKLRELLETAMGKRADENATDAELTKLIKKYI